jgi:MFS family permease
MKVIEATERKLFLVIAAAATGTLIEFYDLILALLLAPVLAQHLFPAGEVRFLETLAIVVTSYLVRPVGALLFGHLGDTGGRKRSFLFSLVLMGGATFLIGCIPSFARVGWLAPVLLLGCRLVQGLAISGEYAGATIYVAEHAPGDKRGFYTGFIQATPALGLLLCLVVVFATRRLLGDASFEDQGWRIPFLFSAVLVGLAYLVRRRLGESPLYAQLQTEGRTSSRPVQESFKAKGNVRLMLLAIFGGCAAQSTLMQTTHFVTLFFLQRTVQLPVDRVLLIMALATLLGSPFFQVFAGLSDRVGRKRVMLTGLVLSTLLVPVAFYLFLHLGNPDGLPQVVALPVATTVQLTLLTLLLHLCCALVYGPLAAFILELFPTRIRYTSMGFAYNIGNGVLGGSTTFLTVWLQRTFPVGAALSPFVGLAYPLALLVIAILINFLFVPETYRRPLTD